MLAAEFGPLGLTLHADKTAVWSPNAAVRQDLPASLRDRWAFHLPVLGSAIPYVRASYPDAEESDPAAEASALQRAVVALQAFQASLLELRAAGLQTEDALGLHRIYVNGAVTHLLRGSLLEADWCDLWDHHVEQCVAQLLYESELPDTLRIQLHMPLSCERTGWGVESARWRREAAFLGSWHLCLGAVAAALRKPQPPQVPGVQRLRRPGAPGGLQARKQRRAAGFQARGASCVSASRAAAAAVTCFARGRLTESCGPALLLPAAGP